MQYPFTERISRQKSTALFEEAKQYFPGGVNSPVRAFKSVHGAPLFIKRGDGSRIYDEDGNVFVDFCASWGPLILGHNDPDIRGAILEAVMEGTSFGGPSVRGMALAKTILKNNRFIEKIRFVSSGTEAVMSAIRLARGYTGRNKVIKFEGCYHGHVDSLMVKAGSGLATFGVSTSAGIPESFIGETLVLPLNNPQLLEEMLQKHGHDVACIIVEPIPANNGLLLQDASFLECLRLKCYKYGVLLIFDEVISGFRVGFEGAAGMYNIKPDIITYGKIIGGGMPVGAYGASAELMAMIAPEGPVYQAGTLSANPVAMAAGLAAVQKLLTPGFYETLESKTQQFVQPILDHCKQKGYPVRIPTAGSIFWLSFSEERIVSADQINAAEMERFKILHFELLQRGIYIGPSGYEVGFVSAAHSLPELEMASQRFCDALDVAFKG